MPASTIECANCAARMAMMTTSASRPYGSATPEMIP